MGVSRASLYLHTLAYLIAFAHLTWCCSAFYERSLSLEWVLFSACMCVTLVVHGVMCAYTRTGTCPVCAGTVKHTNTNVLPAKWCHTSSGAPSDCKAPLGTCLLPPASDVHKSDSLDKDSDNSSHEERLNGTERSIAPPAPLTPVAKRADGNIRRDVCIASRVPNTECDDATLDTVPNGAVRLTGHLIAPHLYHWCTFKLDTINRWGGSVAFTAGCEVAIDQSTAERTAPDGSTVRLGRLVWSKGTVTSRGEFVKNANGDRVLHGYGIETMLDGRTFEGEWRLGKRHGMGRAMLPPGIPGEHINQTSVGCWIDGEPVGRLYGMGPDGYGYSDHSTAKDATGRYLGHRTGVERFECAQESPRERKGPCKRTFPNGDVVVELWESYRVKDVVRYDIVSSTEFGPAAAVHGCTWTVVRHWGPPGDTYRGRYLYYPTDTASDQFTTFAHYVISGRSDAAFSTCQQQAFQTAILEAAAEGGRIDILRSANDRKCRWSTGVCAAAARGGHVACLDYLHTNGCPWNEDTCEAAAEQGHLDCLEYAHTNGCAWDTSQCIRVARQAKHHACADYVRDHAAIATTI